MKRLKVLISFLLIGGLLLIAAGCGGSAVAEDFPVQKKDPKAVRYNPDYDESFEKDMARVSAKLDDFSVKLLTQMPEDQQITSPMSLYLALLNLRLGLQDGPVAEKFDALMRPDNMDEDVYMQVMHQLVALCGDSHDEALKMDMSQLVVAGENPDVKWNESYLEQVKPLLTDVGTLDFKNQETAMNTLNRWADERTNGLIPKIFESEEEVDPEVRMMILNAIYFSGKWENEFNEQLVRKQFRGKDNTSEIDFMELETDLLYSEHDGVQIVSLPYHGGADMEIALGTPDMPLDQVAAALFSQSVSLENREGRVVMPPYALESKLTLNDTLQKMGLEAIFVDLGPNDFFVEPRTLLVSSAVQNIKVNVDREGTEAAAVTRLEIKDTAAMPAEDSTPFTMIIDHPFVFRIVYQGMPLFAGIIKNL